MIFRNLITRLLKKGEEFPFFIKLFKFSIFSFLGIHFLILTINMLPENPIQHQYKYELKNYIDPFFSQAWTLFAPNPINSNMTLLYQFHYTVDGRADSSAWIDVSMPLIEQRKENFWSPAQRVSKFLTSSMEDVNKVHRLSHKFIEESDSLKRSDINLTDFVNERLKYSYGHQSLMEYSQYVSFNYFRESGIDPDSIKVKYKILNAKFPRFSKRDLDYNDLSNYTFTHITSSASVLPMKIYK